MSLRNRMSSGESLFGLFCSTPSSLAVELIAAAGYDFTVIDLEHALIGPETLSAMLLAARASRIAALVRVAAPYQAVQALDAGAEGIVFPRVRTAEAAQAAVRHCHFAPAGERGLNATWRSGFGRDDLASAHAAESGRVLVVAMIEDREGLSQAEAIAATEGVDILLEGAADLSQSLGVPWQTRHPEVLAAVKTIREAARRQGKAFCALPRAPEDFRDWARDQVRMFILGDDRGIARRALAARLALHAVSGGTGE